MIRRMILLRIWSVIVTKKRASEITAHGNYQLCRKYYQIIRHTIIICNYTRQWALINLSVNYQFYQWIIKNYHQLSAIPMNYQPIISNTNQLPANYQPYQWITSQLSVNYQFYLWVTTNYQSYLWITINYHLYQRITKIIKSLSSLSLSY